MKLVDKQDLLEKKTIMWDEAIGFKECVLLDDIMVLPETELIRCKECRHWADGVNGCTEHVKCCKIGFYMIQHKTKGSVNVVKGVCKNELPPNIRPKSGM